MSTEKTFTPEQVAQIGVEYARQRVNQIAKSLMELRDRELKKAIIPPHKHTTGTTSSSGIEDVPPSKANPPGKNDAMKAEETPGEKHGVEELCKMCGKSHGLDKGCNPMDKAMLKDAKGKERDNGINPASVLPEDAKSEEMSHDGSGGDITKGKKLGKSLADIRKAATPPMAKPPSGKNMGTHVPTSKPAGGMVKDVKEMIVHGSKATKPPKDADYEAKQKGDKAVYTTKEELDKAAMNPQMQQHMQAAAGGPAAAAPAPQVQLPSPDQHAARAAAFAAHTPGAGVTGHAMPGPSRPGIFGRLGKSELAKALPGQTSVTTTLPAIKPAGAGLHTVGGPPGSTKTAPSAAPAAVTQPGTGFLPVNQRNKPELGAVSPVHGLDPKTSPAKPSNMPKSPVMGSAGIASVIGAPKPVAKPTTSLASRPLVKPQGAGLAQAGAPSAVLPKIPSQSAPTVASKPKA